MILFKITTSSAQDANQCATEWEKISTGECLYQKRKEKKRKQNKRKQKENKKKTKRKQKKTKEKQKKRKQNVWKPLNNAE